jgi:uncharacterized protein YbjT (DUF2867 family)
LITGATGHVGFRTLVFLLREGYRARIVHRRPEQSALLKSTTSLKPFIDELEFVQVKDFLVTGAFDEAVREVDFVIHVASPVELDASGAVSKDPVFSGRSVDLRAERLASRTIWPCGEGYVSHP